MLKVVREFFPCKNNLKKKYGCIILLCNILIDYYVIIMSYNILNSIDVESRSGFMRWLTNRNWDVIEQFLVRFFHLDY